MYDNDTKINVKRSHRILVQSNFKINSSLQKIILTSNFKTIQDVSKTNFLVLF